MVKRYVLRRNPITGGHYMAEDDATSGKPLFVKDEDYATLAERCERLEAALADTISALEVAEPNLEILHSVVQSSQAREIAWKRLKECRNAIAKNRQILSGSSGGKDGR